MKISPENIPMKVICINSKNFPNEIPLSKRPKEGEVYTVIDAIKCNAQGGQIAFVLEEIDLKGCEPYEGFGSWRFAPDVDITELIEETKQAQEVL